jgi:hypothetical protein
MKPLWGDRPPAFADVRPVLDLLVESVRGAPWHEVLVEQTRSVRGVAGSHWYADLVLAGEVPPLPDEVPNPCAGLVSRDGVLPIGFLLLWLDDTTGAISRIEYAAIEVEEVGHYPRIDELEFEPDRPSDPDLRPSVWPACRAAPRDGLLLLTSSVPARLSQLIAVADELRRTARELPEVDARWQRVLDELWCDLQVHLAACAGRVGPDGVLSAVDAASMGHTLDHLHEVRAAQLAGGRVPLESFSRCGCAAGAWLCPRADSLPGDAAGWGSYPGTHGARPGARWWRWVLGAVGLVGLVVVTSVVAVAVGPPWQQILVPGVVGVLVGGAFAARRSAAGTSGEVVGLDARSGARSPGTFRSWRRER